MACGVEVMRKRSRECPLAVGGSRTLQEWFGGVSSALATDTSLRTTATVSLCGHTHTLYHELTRPDMHRGHCELWHTHRSLSRLQGRNMCRE